MNRPARFLVSYDISHPKRLRRVAKAMEGFGVRLQFSVFECVFDPLRLERCKAALQAIVNHDEDQVLFVSLGPSVNDASLSIDALGRPYLVRSRVTIVGAGTRPAAARRLPAGSWRTKGGSGAPVGDFPPTDQRLSRRSAKRTIASCARPERAGRPRSEGIVGAAHFLQHPAHISGPGGTFETSPALQCWVSDGEEPSPDRDGRPGRTLTRPSLRDLCG